MGNFLRCLCSIVALPLQGMGWHHHSQIYQPEPLKEQCLRFIAKNWNASLVFKKQKISAKDLLEILEAQDVFEKFEKASLNHRNAMCPTAVARDADVEKWAFSCATVSDDGRWAIGWQRFYIEDTGISFYDLGISGAQGEWRYLGDAYLKLFNYVFLSNDSVLFGDKSSLYEGEVKELFAQGYNGLKRVFTRIDGKKYESPSCSNGLEALSPSKVVCVGPNCLEVMDKDESGWKCIKIIKLSGEIEHLCVARARKFAITTEKPDLDTLHFYDLAAKEGAHLGKLWSYLAIRPQTASSFLSRYSILSSNGSISIPVQTRIRGL